VGTSKSTQAPSPEDLSSTFTSSFSFSKLVPSLLSWLTWDQLKLPWESNPVLLSGTHRQS
jgi:hypothetical protein